MQAYRISSLSRVATLITQQPRGSAPANFGFRYKVRIATAPGDYIFVPPYVPHREENPDPENPAVIVIARSTQEAIVVNLPALYALSEHSE